jgi:hypothetical protein
MAGSYGHYKLQENISRYLKELDSGLVLTSPRLTERQGKKHRRNETQNLPKITSKTPEPARINTKTEIFKALKIIQKRPEELSLKKPVERQGTLKTYFKDDPAIKGFVDSIFSSEPSSFKKSSFNSDLDNFDVVSADKILIEARKIIKSGVRKKKRENQAQDDIEYFWKNYISKDLVVRWDIFEENFLTFIFSYMVTDVGLIRKVNWRKVLQKLFSRCSKELILNQNWLRSPSIEKSAQVIQKTMSLHDFGRVFQSQDLCRMVFNSIDELLPDPIRHKEDKDFFYSCGCIYRGQWKEGKRDGAGLLKLCSQERYEGYFTKGLFHSYGTLTFTSFSYKGFFKKDHFHGFGKLIYPNGSSFEGIFNKSHFSKGTLKFSDARVYTGEFLNQNFEGKGEMLSLTKEVHKGMWAEGKLNGDCKIIYSDGTRISGVFLNGVIGSSGTLKNSQFKYSGQFNGTVPNGQGKFWYKSGISYEGGVKNARLDGFGLMTFPNGDVYEGDFCDSEQIGAAKITYSDGRVYEGEVFAGKPQGKGVLTFKVGKILKYDGEFQSGEMQGKGRAWFLGQKEFSGDWKDGKVEGLGEIRTPEFLYQGEILDMKFHGQGFLKLNQGFYNGEWEKGKPEGKGEVQDEQNNTFIGMFQDGHPLIKTKVEKAFLEKISSIDLSFLLV